MWECVAVAVWFLLGVSVHMIRLIGFGVCV